MYRKASTGWIKHIDFEVLDIIGIELAFLFAYYYRHYREYYYEIEHYKRLFLLIVLIDAVVILFSKNYDGIVQRGFWSELWASIQHVTIVSFVLLVYEFVLKETDVLSRFVFFLGWGVGIVFCFVFRLVWKRVLRYYLTREKNQSKILLISTVENVQKTIEQINAKKYKEYKICGISVLESKQDKRIDANIPILYGEETLTEFVKKNVVDQVYFDCFEDKEVVSALVDLFLGMGITVHMGMNFLPDDLPNKFLEKIGTTYVITSSLTTVNMWEVVVKRLVDIIGAIVGLVLCGIAYVVVGPIIKKESPGPVFFCQERVGKNGRIFKFYKFRSMYLDAEERKKNSRKKMKCKDLCLKWKMISA